VLLRFYNKHQPKDALKHARSEEEVAGECGLDALGGERLFVQEHLRSFGNHRGDKKREKSGERAEKERRREITVPGTDAYF